MMSRVLLIEEGGFPLAPMLSQGGCDAEVLLCGPRDWTSRVTMGSRADQLDLIIAAALEVNHEWLALFETLRAGMHRPPLLAILGDRAAPDLLGVVAGVADDFIIWSDNRASELRERVMRLLGPAEKRR